MELTIAFCGDIILASEVDRFIGKATAGEWLSGVASAWEGADVLIGNLESPCVAEAKPLDGPVPELIFHAPARRLGELAKAGFSAVTLANNHILNCGPSGLHETRQILDNVGIRHTGAGMNLDEAIRPAFIPVGSLTIGLVAFCYTPPAGRSHAGVAPCEPKWMRKALNLARANADIVIASLHDGLEYSDVPPSQTRQRFRFLAENGADIVFGHHPHVLQGLEWHGNVPIAYSLGDLLSHNSLPEVASRNFARIAMGRLAPQEVARDRERFSRGAVLTVRISGSNRAIHWHPFRQDASLRPQLSSGDDKLEDLKNLADLTGALVNPKDRRHFIADEVIQTTIAEAMNNLKARQLLRLACRPKWRYVPRGINWLLKKTMRAWNVHK